MEETETLQELRKGLVQEARAEAKKIIGDMEKQGETKLSAVKAEAKKISAEAKARAEQAVAAERNERISAAQLRAKKIIAEAMNKVVEQGLADTWSEFTKVPEKKEVYEKLMKQVISTGEKELGGDCIVMVNRKDSGLAKKLSKNVSKEEVEISGGAIISTKDGSITIDNSLEAIFSQNEEETRKLVYTEVFGGKRK